MGQTAVSNTAVITLQPTGVSSGTALNPAFTICDPLNGNYFVASGRDLVTLFCYPGSSAPAWNSVVTYTQGQVVNAGSPPTPYIAVTNVASNVNQNPVSNPSFWVAYTGSVVTLYSAPDACTGRKSDVTNYTVPVPEVGGLIEFQILPSSVFTQTTGFVQFLASSNLVHVNVSSL